MKSRFICLLLTVAWSLLTNSASAFWTGASSEVKSFPTPVLSVNNAWTRCNKWSNRICSSSSTAPISLSMGLTLYGSQGSRSPLINWAACELGLEVAMGDLGQNPHPFRQIPCLTDDSDVVVFESGAILLYLLSKADPSLSAKKLGAIMSWTTWANASLDPICFLETPDGKVYDTGLKKPNKKIDALDAILAKRQFLLEDGFSVADVAVGSYLLYVPQFFGGDINLSRWPNVVRYMKDCAKRPCYGEAFTSDVQEYLVGLLESMEGDQGSKKIFGMF